MKWLPKDTTITRPLTVVHGSNGSCAGMNLISPTLAKSSELGATNIGDSNGTIGVEFYYTNQNSQSMDYSASNVQDSEVGVSTFTSGNSC